jgi:hypothetical protein
MAQTVYVLGAGASFGDNLIMADEARWRQVCQRDPRTEIDPATATNPPLITGFFDAKNMWWSYPERIEELNRDLVKYIRRRWGIEGPFGKDDWLNVNLEDVFTSAAIDVEFNPTGTDVHAKSQLLLNRIKRHVSFVLGRSTICRYGKQTRALVNSLDESDTIINFNYDLLVDQELITSNAGVYFPREGAYQYHNFADVILDKPFNDYPLRSRALREKNTGEGLYLKMHGSLNWTNCTNTSCPRSTSIEIGDVFHSLLLRNSPTGGPPRCDTCKGEVSTVIVPPLLNKPVMHSPVFRNIWSNALEALKQAQKIVVIGYSFPPTDFYTEWLFRSAWIDDETPIQIVNPLNDPDHRDQKERERFVKRMQSLFPHRYDSELTTFDQMDFDHP